MKEFLQQFWYDMHFARALMMALLMGAGAFYAMPKNREVSERLVNAAIFAVGGAGAALSSSSGNRPNGGNGK